MSGRRLYDQGLLYHVTARLTDVQRRALDAPITANDLYWAITKSPTGRSTSYDGLPAEYYQLNPQRWSQVFEIVYATNFDRGIMSESQRKTYISLLYKGGDRSFPRNYRSLTLLNHDAKFGPKVLAWRLRAVFSLLFTLTKRGLSAGSPFVMHYSVSTTSILLRTVLVGGRPAPFSSSLQKPSTASCGTRCRLFFFTSVTEQFSTPRSSRSSKAPWSVSWSMGRLASSSS